LMVPPLTSAPLTVSVLPMLATSPCEIRIPTAPPDKPPALLTLRLPVLMTPPDTVPPPGTAGVFDNGPLKIALAGDPPATLRRSGARAPAWRALTRLSVPLLTTLPTNVVPCFRTTTSPPPPRSSVKVPLLVMPPVEPNTETGPNATAADAVIV